MTSEELKLFDYVIELAIGESHTDDIQKILNLEDKIKLIDKKYKHLEDKNKKLRTELELYENFDKTEKQRDNFINYLENKLILINNILTTEEDEDNIYHALVRKTAFEEILSKFKEITGDE